MKRNKKQKLLFWLPRGLAIAFILFVAVFSLDVFDTNQGFWMSLRGLLMHNIPTFVLILMLWISWRHEKIGGTLFILAGIIYAFFAFSRAGDWVMALLWSAQLSGIAFVIGGLFWLDDVLGE